MLLSQLFSLHKSRHLQPILDEKGLLNVLVRRVDPACLVVLGVQLLEAACLAILVVVVEQEADQVLLHFKIAMVLAHPLLLESNLLFLEHLHWKEDLLDVVQDDCVLELFEKGVKLHFEVLLVELEPVLEAEKESFDWLS